ncbi:MAG: biotin--[acetyl-CoA-carboxylase] ligase [Candidatus Paracaedibacteraceae bacterium]|nr:biotin--[acetyl-CoA-carboxylase] ligase [Candidatus Paracaedibacteraceae bacterium]
MTYKFFTYDQVESSNDEARELFAEQNSGDVVVIAKSQIKGRGRRGRRWYSPPGNLYMTFTKTPPVNPASLGQISLVVGLAVYKVVRGIVGEKGQLALKWPNDVLINKMKVGGILVETEQFPGQEHLTCIIGVGVNFMSSPEMVIFPACSLYEFTKELPDLEDFTRDVLTEFDSLYNIWVNEGFEKIRNEWLIVSYGLGKPVSARAENGFEIYGRFLTLSLDGAVVVCDDSGNEYLVRSSEITYL